ncbi:MAG: hypothetical protein Q4F18_00075 [Clostridia bacterium]|nr:hypothetical protein [Clostridia bacterium]
MKSQGIRHELLRTGMGCFLFASGVTVLNVLLLPYARACYGYGAPAEFIALGLSLALFVLLGKTLRRTDDTRLAHIRRIAVPGFLLALLALQLLCGYLMEYTPSGDNFMLYNGSQMLASDGNFERYPDFGLYLARFSNQWGFLLMLTAFYKALFALGIANTFFPLVLVQALLYTAGIRAALDIARRLRGVRGELMLLCMLALCLPLYMAAGVLYTDTFSLPFVLLALDFALRAAQAQDARGQIANAALCGLMTVIGGQIKMIVAIVLIAAVIVWLLTMRPGRALLCAGLCAAMMAASSFGVQQIMLGQVLDPAVYAQQHTPIIHWIMMSIPTGDNPYGGFSGDYGITWGMMDEGASHEEVMASIYTRMKDRIYTLRYPSRLITAALRKNAAGMGDGTFGMTEMLDDGPVRENALSAIVLEGRAHYPLYTAVCSGMFMAHMLLAFLGCLRDIRRRDLRAALLYVAMFGMMFFLMIWEARSRYVFGFVPVVLLLSCACVTGGEHEKEPDA